MYAGEDLSLNHYINATSLISTIIRLTAIKILTIREYLYLNIKKINSCVYSDQRITQDVDRFTDQLSQSMPDLVIAPIVIVYYTYQTTKK